MSLEFHLLLLFLLKLPPPPPTLPSKGLERGLKNKPLWDLKVLKELLLYMHSYFVRMCLKNVYIYYFWRHVNGMI